MTEVHANTAPLGAPADFDLTIFKPTPLQVECLDIACRPFFEHLLDSGELAAAGYDMIDGIRITPNLPIDDFNALYEAQSQLPGFSPLAFAKLYAGLPTRTNGESIRYKAGDNLDDHARDVLLAHVGIVGDKKILQSGGRYSDGREGRAMAYYWDSMGIIEGLDTLADHYERKDEPLNALELRELASGITERYRHEIITTRRGPRNATEDTAPEYKGRSQPHKYVRMVRREVRLEGPEAYRRHLPAMLIEYFDIMQGADDPELLPMIPGKRYKSVARMPDLTVSTVFSAEGFTYPNGDPRPRPESRPADLKTMKELAKFIGRPLTKGEEIDLCEELHTGAGAGTDFASWMLGDGKNLHTIRVTKRVPPFKHALVFELACEIANGLRYVEDEAGAQAFERIAYELAQTLNNFSYNKKLGYYLPWDLETGQVMIPTLQDGAFAIESGIAQTAQRTGIFDFWESTQEEMEEIFDSTPEAEEYATQPWSPWKAPGGLLTSLYPTEQSWVHEKIWAVLEKSAAKASWLGRRQHLEKFICNGFTTNVQLGRLLTGHTIERYDAFILGRPANGGEYIAPRHNFSWTEAIDAVLRHCSYRNYFERRAWKARCKVAAGVGVCTTGQMVYLPKIAYEF
ncbi:MAG TPA: trehalase family glycosidase [Candidatus Saccharimonadales bacterium]|nr:trehalase family glycosidase [Candidatus Saccharimonadales bacterium]